MKQYYLFWNDNKCEPEAIQSGFSYFAFLFTFLYPAYKGQMKTALTYFMGWIAISLIGVYFAHDPIFNTLLNMLFSLFIAIDYADCAVSEFHKDKNIQFIGTEFAENSEHALFLAFQQHVNSLNKPHV